MASAFGSQFARPPDVNRSQTLPRVFISHSSGDNAFGYAIAERLRAAGIDTWYDSLGGPDSSGAWQGSIPPATDWQTEIVRELTQRSVFVVILSLKSVASKWVLEEIRLAWSQKNSADVTRGKIIVPILRETCTVPPLVSLVQYINFRPGMDEERAWDELLYAVQSNQTRPAPGVELGPPFDLGLLPPLERFIGREHDVAWIMDRLTSTNDQSPSVGIAGIAGANGLAGIGKTALATEVVRQLMARTEFQDGIAVISCKGQTDSELLLRQILSRFTIGRREPEEITLASLADRTRQLLIGKHALVVLDNVEQALPVNQVLQPLRTAGVAVLLTSRAELPAVPRYANLTLDILPTGEALDLFAEYYGRGAIQTLRPDEQAAANSIVSALGRHPLAIKLAAANAATLKRPLDRVATELSEQPRRALFLNNGEEAVRYVLDSSYEALSAPAQLLFVLTSAFSTADFGRAAILAVARAVGYEPVDLQPTTRADQSSSDALYSQALQDLIMIRMADPALLEGVPDESDRERIRLHPLVEAYARRLFEQLDAVRQSEALRVAATWYANYANAAYGVALEADERNIYGALDWAHGQHDDELVALLCIDMEVFWRIYARTDEWNRYLAWGLEATERLSASGDRDYRLRHALMQLTDVGREN